MIKITAHMPARTIKSRTGKVFNYQARDEIYEQDETGQWHTEICGKKECVFESEVIDACRKATNWREIRAKHFPMFGFHN